MAERTFLWCQAISRRTIIIFPSRNHSRCGKKLQSSSTNTHVLIFRNNKGAVTVEIAPRPRSFRIRSPYFPATSRSPLCSRTTDNLPLHRWEFRAVFLSFFFFSHISSVAGPGRVAVALRRLYWAWRSPAIYRARGIPRLLWKFRI